jgi:hypothetical protein
VISPAFASGIINAIDAITAAKNCRQNKSILSPTNDQNGAASRGDRTQIRVDDDRRCSV